MSLIHWWPLNGDLIDKCTGNSLNNGGWTVNNSGKIGKCYNANNGAVVSRSLTISPSFSFACWVKNIDCATYPKTHLPLKFSNGQVYSTGAAHRGWDFSHGTADGNYRFTINDGALAPISLYWSNADLLPKKFSGWHHICLSCDYNQKTVDLYVNGIHAGTNSLGSLSDAYSGTFVFTLGQVYGWKLDGYVNDFRIYDHALSQAEVKELSKALVVHYTFDDALAEPTTNVSTVNGWSTYSSYWTISERTKTGLKLYRHAGSTSDCVAIQNSAVTSKMAQDDIWTFSCYLYKNGQPWKSTASGISSEGYGYRTVSWESREDGYYRITFRVISSPGAWVLHNYFFSPIDKSVDCEMRYMQFEKNDHATPYTPTSRESQLYNEAGFVQPSTKNNIAISTDSGVGIYSLSCKGSTTIATSNTCDISQGTTASVWIKGTIPTDSRLVFADNNSKTAFGFFNNGQAIITCAGYGYAHVSDIKTGWTTDWNHIVVTRDSSGNISCYLNNNKLALSGSQEWTHNIASTLSIGCRYNGGWTSYFTGLVDDFRFYATCLSTNDITELYKTKAYITDKSDVMCGEFVENKIEAGVTEKSTFDCKEVCEQLDVDSDYECAEYIEFSETQYIDTGLAFTDAAVPIIIEADIVKTAISGNDCLAGCGVGSSWQGPVMLNCHNYTLEFGVNGYATASDGSGSIALNERMSIRAEIYTNGNDHRWYKNGNRINLGSSAYKDRTSSNSTLYIGAFHNGTSNSIASGSCWIGRLYSFKVWYGDSCRILIPAKRKSDNAFGLYDMAEHNFYPNIGGGSLSGIPALTNAAIYQDGRIGGREIIEI